MMNIRWHGNVDDVSPDDVAKSLEDGIRRGMAMRSHSMGARSISGTMRLDTDPSEMRSFVRAFGVDLPPDLTIDVPDDVPTSDAVTVTLADDATWQHMRGLYPSPEKLEGI